MKQLYTGPVLQSIKKIGRPIITVLFLSTCLSSVFSQSLVPELVFMNPKLKTGSGYPSAGADGALYIFSNVSQGIDALVTIDGRSSADVKLSNPDLAGPEQDATNGTGYDNAWQPRVSYNNGTAPANKSWWMEFRISFVKHTDHSQPVSVNQFFVSGLDVDGDGQQLHEFQSYYKMQYFTLEQNSDVIPASITGCIADNSFQGKRFDGPDKNYPGVTPDATDAMVTNFYTNSSSLVVRVGAVTGNVGSNATDRMYSLWFKSFTYDVPVSTPLPVTLVAFTAQLKSQDVKLNWTTTMESNASQFTVQRSTDGNAFDDDAIVFTDGNSDIRKDYHYTDRLSMLSVPMVYYRLKMVDLDSKSSYSEVIVVRVSDDPLQQQVIVFPNPVANELRVTIPVSWQSKPVAYNLYNINGVLIKQHTSENAGQTESLYVADLPAGVYFIKTVNGNETAVQKFIKANS